MSLHSAFMFIRNFFLFFRTINCQDIFSGETHWVIPHGRLWRTLLHLKECSAMWEYRTPLVRENIYILPLTHYTCTLWTEFFPISCLTYLKSCSKPKWYNHVSVQLGPHIKYWHDEWNHQQLQCLKKKKLPSLSQKHKKLKRVGGAMFQKWFVSMVQHWSLYRLPQNLFHYVPWICSKTIEKVEKENLFDASLLHDHAKAKGSNLCQVKEQVQGTPLLAPPPTAEPCTCATAISGHWPKHSHLGPDQVFVHQVPPTSLSSWEHHRGKVLQSIPISEHHSHHGRAWS